MRQRDIHTLLKWHSKALEPRFAGLNGERIDFSNRNEVEEAARALSDVPSLEDKAKAVLSEKVFQRSSTVVDTGEQSRIGAYALALGASAKAVMEFLDATLPAPPSIYFAVRLPDSSNALDVESKVLNRIFMALDHPMRLLGYDALRVSLIDKGSTWVELAVQSVPALGVIGTIISCGIGIAKYAREKVKLEQDKVQLQQELARAAQEESKAEQEDHKAKQEELRLKLARIEYAIKIAERRRELASLQAEAEVDALAASAVVSSNEQRNALMAGIEEIASLYAEGARFRGQLDAPPEVAAVLPEEMRAGELPSAKAVAALKRPGE